MQTHQEKLKLLTQIKANPELAILRMVENANDIIDKKISEIEKVKKEVKQEIETIMENAIDDFKNDIEEKINAKKENHLFNRLSQIKGEDGEKGKRGEDGKDGYTPQKGIDYFDGEKGDIPVKGVDYSDGEDGYTPIKGIDYNDGEDGYTPIKGKDYFDGQKGEDGSPDSPDQIADKINTLEEKIEQKTIKGLLKEFETLKIMVQNVSRKSSGGGGGMGNIIAEAPSGTINGVNTVFTLTNFPKTNALLLFWNGQLQRLTSEYTLSGKTITFLTAPTAGEVYAWYVRG